MRAAGNIVPCGTFRGYMGAISKTLFHVEPSCVTCFAIFTEWSPYKLGCEMCAAVFHVERSCPKPEVGVQNLAYAAKQFASRVRMGDGAACSAEITGNRISSESRWGMPCSTWNKVAESFKIQCRREKSCVIKSMGRRPGNSLCPRGGAAEVNLGLGWVRPSPRCGSFGSQGGRELRSRE